jgi:hypothetical protein
MDVKWKKHPEAHDYPAAGKYLELLTDATTVKRILRMLIEAPTTTQKAKDILRASQLPLLDSENVHVAANLRKIAAGEELSPVLLVRGDLAAGVALQVADGYHRVCASYLTDENTDIPVKLVG